MITLSYVDPAWTTASTFDIINPLPPFQSIADDATVSAVGATTITLTTVPDGLAKNQWVCPAMLSCIPQIPYEFFPLLTEMTVAALSEGLDMSQILATAKAKIENYMTAAAKLARPRVTGSPKLIISKDAFNQRGFGGAGGGWR